MHKHSIAEQRAALYAERVADLIARANRARWQQLNATTVPGQRAFGRVADTAMDMLRDLSREVRGE